MADTETQTDIRIIEEHTDTSAERQGKVTVEAGSYEAATSAEARNKALEYAGSKWGMSKAGISNFGNAFPAQAQRADGSIDDAKLREAVQGPMRFRAEYTITAGL